MSIIWNYDVIHIYDDIISVKIVFDKLCGVFFLLSLPLMILSINLNNDVTSVDDLVY